MVEDQTATEFCGNVINSVLRRTINKRRINFFLSSFLSGCTAMVLMTGRGLTFALINCSQCVGIERDTEQT